MSRKRNRNYAYPIPPERIAAFKADVMSKEGYTASPGSADQVKYEVAQSMGIPLSPLGNGGLTTEDAGKIGGQIGGSMVREMIKMAKRQLMEKQNHP